MIDDIDYPCSQTYEEAMFIIKASDVDYSATPEYINYSFNRKLKKKLAKLMLEDESETNNDEEELMEALR